MTRPGRKTEGDETRRKQNEVEEAEKEASTILREAEQLVRLEQTPPLLHIRVYFPPRGQGIKVTCCNDFPAAFCRLFDAFQHQEAAACSGLPGIQRLVPEAEL